MFNGLNGVTGPLPELLETGISYVNEFAPGNHFTYTASGNLHVILLRPDFDAYVVDGVRVRDWVAALVAGEEIDNVACMECEEAEVTEGE